MNDRNFDEKEIKILLGISGFTFIIWFVGIFLIGETKETGDRASALEALFSAAGLIGLLATLYLQRKELGLQRRELRLTRDELALTREEVKKSC
jgi:hypothetical protein